MQASADVQLPMGEEGAEVDGLRTRDSLEVSPQQLHTVVSVEEDDDEGSYVNADLSFEEDEVPSALTVEESAWQEESAPGWVWLARQPAYVVAESFFGFQFILVLLLADQVLFMVCLGLGGVRGGVHTGYIVFDCVIATIFLLEVNTRLFSFGYKHYFRNLIRTVDYFLVVTTSVVVFAAAVAAPSAKWLDLVRFVRLFRLLTVVVMRREARLKNRAINELANLADVLEMERSEENRLIKWRIDSTQITIGEAAGEGGFGAVFLGLFRGTLVAVKQLYQNNDKAAEYTSIEEEAVTLVNLRHPNVVLFMGFVHELDKLWIVTEYCSRGSLRDLLDKEAISLTQNRVLKFALGAARGLAYLHGQDPPVLHLDLKTSNILISSGWETKLADFGLSRNIDNIQNNTFAGTIQYSAPEILESNSFSTAADVYSFGICLWEIAARGIPFAETSPMEVLWGVVKEQRRPPLDLIRDRAHRDLPTPPRLNQLLPMRQLNNRDRPEGPQGDACSDVQTAARIRLLDSNGILNDPSSMMNAAIVVAAGGVRQAADHKRRFAQAQQNHVSTNLAGAGPNDIVAEGAGATSSADVTRLRNPDACAVRSPQGSQTPQKMSKSLPPMSPASSDSDVGWHNLTAQTEQQREGSRRHSTGVVGLPEEVKSLSERSNLSSGSSNSRRSDASRGSRGSSTRSGRRQHRTTPLMSSRKGGNSEGESSRRLARTSSSGPKRFGNASPSNSPRGSSISSRVSEKIQLFDDRPSIARRAMIPSHGVASLTSALPFKVVDALRLPKTSSDEPVAAVSDDDSSKDADARSDPGNSRDKKKSVGRILPDKQPQSPRAARREYRDRPSGSKESSIQQRSLERDTFQIRLQSFSQMKPPTRPPIVSKPPDRLPERSTSSMSLDHGTRPEHFRNGDLRNRTPSKTEGAIGMPEEYILLISECWAQDPADRPKVDEVVWRLVAMIDGHIRAASQSVDPIARSTSLR